MKEINIAEADVAAVATRIGDFSSHISDAGTSVEDSRHPAIKVIHCVLSLRASYDKVVAPRLKTFMSTHPDIQQINDLANFMEGFQTPYEFIQQELNYNSERKAKMLQQVVKFLREIIQKAPGISEEESLKKWAIQAEPQECYKLNIKYFAIAGFQYLRMLFGADTAKPDVHIIRFLSELLNRNVSRIEAILLLEAASARIGFSVRAVDNFIWKRGSRGSGPNLVRLDPDVAAAFLNEEAVNEALRSVLKERGKEK